MVTYTAVSGIGSEGLPFYSKEELQQAPSVKDGLEPHREAQFRRQYTHFITDVGKTLQVPQWAIYTAVFLTHHYFAKRSMQRSDRYLVATACLYLACKVQERPKYLRDVIKEAERKKWERYAKEHPGEPKKWEDIPHLETMRDQVLVAERAVLYTISFQLRIKTPYPDIIQLHKSLVPDGPTKQDIFQIAWSLMNDSLHTTLSLQYAPEKLAAAALYVALQMAGMPLPHKDGHGFCELTNITADELQDIAGQMLDIYTAVASHTRSAPGTPGQPPRVQGQPSSPEDSHLQLQGNRVALAMQPQHQQQLRSNVTLAATPGQQPQQQQQNPDATMQQQTPPQQQQQLQRLANGVQQHAGPAG